ncbi:MAG: 2-oxo acid dehydrogenase subunit E2 [Gammaproteobacteria bacterium]|uniref:dihydrolipoamide acetyltransferase family protein n=1 Tax=Rhodoferax sp. TaxID=50421 RepID=UPI0018368397|nr:dihydrolipoamide acetyltransferase family protein [Rhodoferax sp.]MBU3898529.1 2-oxo acid dehydrogenase subunit E2 [Gammaproteobacteria bacterium]MBA3056830.1 2-oxo acid dehydrogenase subunit E2 [Rhodoferax sp.]MBU3997856.1 2-oxo acid dehydrogenase subunit E2 [Gammaproteobacteria bacterium]MBU4079304.1 2-oxo acid dehydrogenase subunit E2 [Gammaproteobacteria bacterium]MBU4113234.1 2-oxo acid dehydrogenase subunit E2 [Gammaproteobacteria bacterium]
MSIQTIKMPDIGEGIAEVELVAWHVKVGDVVAEDQILADVMTDKATVEIPSSVAGTVVSLNVTAGQVVAVGTEIIHIEVLGSAQAGVGATVVPAPAAAAISAAPAVAAAVAAAAPAATVSTASAAVAEVPAPEAAPAATKAVPPARPVGDLPIASPAIRRQAWELGIDLATVTGTGTAGRITQEDLDACAKPGGHARTSAGFDPRYAQRDAEEVIPVIGLRRKIAQKMQDAKRRIPHFTYVEEIDVTELEDLRARLNAQYGATRGRLTLLPFLIRAMVLALRDHPEVNARYDDDAGVVTRYGAVHLGMATQTTNGLMVPVIRHAETLDLWATASAVLRASEAARSGKAAREDLSGSTITLTSLGALGGIVSTPVINHPEVGIVGTNRIVERPMIKGSLVVARKMMNLSSSFDHRVVDGMYAAQFIQKMRGYLECPGTLLVA